MKTIFSVYKPMGKTPYEVIQQLQYTSPEYRASRITYAGRLDPLAHGVLLLLVDDAIARKDEFLSLTKTYEYETVFGVETDSYDFLGFVQEDTSKNVIPAKAGIYFSGSPIGVGDDIVESILVFIRRHLGEKVQSYPPFSSKTVNGKPLFWWTKQNRLNEITIPTREIAISDFALLQMGEYSAETLEQKVIDSVDRVSGDFRQEETLARWKQFFANNKQESFTTARFRITCSSGTYVRGLVHSLGKTLGTGAVTSEILRRRVGEYSLEDTLRIF